MATSKLFKVNIDCKRCKKAFTINTCYLGKKKFCSKKCYSEFIKISGLMKGEKNPFWGKKHTKESRNKITLANTGRKAWNKGLVGYLAGENHYNWKGDNAGYHSLHKWISKLSGKANKCAECGSTRYVQWANLSHHYKRDETDWKQLCAKCHQTFDRRTGWGDAVTKFSGLL